MPRRRESNRGWWGQKLVTVSFGTAHQPLLPVPKRNSEREKIEM